MTCKELADLLLEQPQTNDRAMFLAGYLEKLACKSIDHFDIQRCRLRAEELVKLASKLETVSQRRWRSNRERWAKWKREGGNR